MVQSITPKGMAPPFARYAHGVRSGDLILTSGQLSLGVDGTVPEGAEAQARLIFGNIDLILAEAGAGRADVLKVQAYVTDRVHMGGYMAARDAWLAEIPHLPASTLMIVSGFTRPDFLVEIEVTARLGTAG